MADKVKSQEELKKEYENKLDDFTNSDTPQEKFEVKKKEKFDSNVQHAEIKPLSDNYVNNVYTSKIYSLDVDPLNEYNMTDNQKLFIRNYGEYGNIPIAAQLTGIDENEALTYFRMVSTQNEIRRIRLARYHRAFAGKVVSLDEIGAYLTALLIDEVPTSDKLNSQNKLKVVELLIKINDLKTKVINDPTIIDTIDVEEQIKNLSLSSIENLIKNSNKKSDKSSGNNEEKDDLISQIQELNDERLSAEEISDLRAMSIESLVEILNSLSDTKN